MSLFSFGKSSERIGAIIDIGSGSVLTAIIVSDESKPQPTIVWSHREHAPLRDIDSLNQSSKAVMTALMSALMKLEGEGREALNIYRKGGKILEFQCTICAPWSYTVTKTINYKQDEPFEITDELISQLVQTALDNTASELKENDTVKELGLTVIARTTMDLLANGYRVRNPLKQKAQELTLTHASVVTQQYLIDTIDELKEKVLPTATSKKLSFMLAFYCMASDYFPDIHDLCLIDITYEATEIGIIRDGSLQYSTHTPFGAFSLAREIAAITGVTAYEAFQYLHTDTPYEFMEALKDSQKDEINKVFEAYVQKLIELFKETGDDLTIPKRIFIHADLKSEPFFSDLIKRAAEMSTKSSPIIKLITPQILKTAQGVASSSVNDTAMLVSAQFFHKQNHCRDFEYL